MRIPERLPIGMSAKTAACGVIATLSLSGVLLSFGAKLATEGATSINILLAILGTFMLGIILFTAWNTGRGSGDDGRGYGHNPVVPPLGGEALQPKTTKTPEPAAPSRSI